MSPFPCVSSLRASIHVIRPSPEARPDCRASMIIPEIEGSGTEWLGEPWHCPGDSRITTVASGSSARTNSIRPGFLRVLEVDLRKIPAPCALWGMRDPELRHPESSFNRNPESGISNREVFVDCGRRPRSSRPPNILHRALPLAVPRSRFPASRILLHPESGIRNLES